MDALKDKLVAVTGATGYLGRYIAKELHDQGARVVAVVRNPGKVPELARAGIELRTADLADRAALARAFAGCDAVVANAGQVSLGNDFEALIRQNNEGTANTLEACAQAGVGRVVAMSSASVYRKLRADVGLSEDAQLRSLQDPKNRTSVYAISKACAEQEAWRLARERQLELTTLRPYAIFGAYDQNSFSLWFERLMRLPVAPFPVFLNLPMVYAGDLARAVSLALVQPAAVGEAFNIGGENMDFWEFANRWTAAGGFHPRLRIPVPVPFTRRLDDGKIRRLLGWHTRPVEESCREIAAVYARGGHFA